MISEPKNYILKQIAKIFRDSPQNIDFHIKSDDYFAVIATALGFIEEALLGKDTASKERELAHELRRDLRYVQANYKIVPRALGDIRIVRPKSNLLAKDS